MPKDRQGGGGGQKFGSTATSGQQRIRGIGRVAGEILKVDNSSLIVKAQAGGSRIVFYSDKTQILIFKAPTTTPQTL